MPIWRKVEEWNTKTGDTHRPGQELEQSVPGELNVFCLTISPI